ncbi:MAG: response regulator, partial [Cyanothece sp. SIO2G6]|nr:response regulator [Cyanothece sp. SIO2G6]
VISVQEVNFIQAIVHQVAIAIAQAHLREQVREQSIREASINKILGVLYEAETVQLQQALEAIVEVYQCVGGRLYFRQENVSQQSLLYACGQQPTPLPGKVPRPLEENALWQQYLDSSPTGETESGQVAPWSVPWMKAMYAMEPIPDQQGENSSIWAVADLYTEPLLRSVSSRFQQTEIRGLLICPLSYGNETIGCLTLFRKAVDKDITWAGYHNPDERQLMPRQSFNAWKQLIRGQAEKWQDSEIRLIQFLAERLIIAFKQDQLTQRIHALNTSLERQIAVRTEELSHTTAIAHQQRTLARILSRIQAPLDLTTLFKIATEEVQQLFKVDRVAIYKFDQDWGGEFIDTYGTVSQSWAKIMLATRNTWNDDYLQKTAGGRYKNHEISAVSDIYAEDLSACHIEMLEHYYVRAYIIAPIFVHQKLWGLLGIYQHEITRVWQDAEVNFIQQVATHLGIALQQHQSIEQIKIQANELKVIAEQQQTLNTVITKIRESLNLETIFQTTTFELRRLLGVDRVVIFQFSEDSQWQDGKIVAENIGALASSILGLSIESDCFYHKYGGQPLKGQTFVVENVEQSQIADCFRAMLQGLNIRADLVAPLFNGTELWGLLCLHQCSAPRTWTYQEKEFVIQLANQLSVAIYQVQLFQNMEHAQKFADAANQAKSRFLSTISHELRTPLNAVLGMVQLLQRDNSLTEQQAQRLATIGSSGEHLLSLINDVLEMSRIEAGKAKLEEKAIQLPAFLNTLHDILDPTASAKGLSLIFDLAVDLPDYIRTDEGKLRQVLINLLGNALKFTPKGTVTLHSEIVPNLSIPESFGMEGDRPIQLHFAVQDTGPGISAENLESIFEAFNQTEDGFQTQEGTGLGLTICKQFVTLMGGQIAVESEVGVGSTFHFYVEVHHASAAETQSFSRATLGLAPNQVIPKILVVEDQATNRLLLVELLKSLGFEVESAANGQEAIDRWQDWSPDLIWMDLRMPVMDGYAATCEIKRLAQSSTTNNSCPIIIALTANAFEEDRKRALDTGCDDFVRKPYQEQDLLDTMAKYLGVTYLYQDNSAAEVNQPFFIAADSSIAETLGSTIPETASVPLKILVAEDNVHNQDFLDEMLSALGHQVLVVNHGQEAVDAIAQDTYDVLMFDLHMPVMDGLEATRQIRQLELQPQPIILGITGSSELEEIEACKAVGMDRVIQKPLKFRVVNSILASLPIPRIQSSLPQISDVAPSVDQNLQAEDLSEGLSENLADPEIDEGRQISPTVLDRRYLFEDYKEALGDQAAIKIHEYIRKFLSRLPQDVAEIQAAIAIADHDNIFQLAHRLKTPASYLGATDFAQICTDLETAARQNRASDYPLLSMHLNQETERLTLALNLELA